MVIRVTERDQTRRYAILIRDCYWLNFRVKPKDALNNECGRVLSSSIEPRSESLLFKIVARSYRPKQSLSTFGLRLKFHQMRNKITCDMTCLTCKLEMKCCGLGCRSRS